MRALAVNVFGFILVAALVAVILMFGIICGRIATRSAAADEAVPAVVACVTQGDVLAADQKTRPDAAVALTLTGEPAGAFLMRLNREVEGLPGGDTVVVLKAGAASRAHVLIVRGGCVQAAGFVPIDLLEKLLGAKA